MKVIIERVYYINNKFKRHLNIQYKKSMFGEQTLIKQTLIKQLSILTGYPCISVELVLKQKKEALKHRNRFDNALASINGRICNQCACMEIQVCPSHLHVKHDPGEMHLQLKLCLGCGIYRLGSLNTVIDIDNLLQHF